MFNTNSFVVLFLVWVKMGRIYDYFMSTLNKTH